MRLMIQVLALMLVLMFGIFLGIDTAEQNIQSIQGSEGAPRAIHVTPENGRVEIAVLGHVVDTGFSEEQLEKEEKPSEELPQESQEKNGEAESTQGNESTLLAQMGNNVGQGIREGTRKVLNSVVEWVRGR